MISWIILSVSILFEVTGTLCLKYSSVSNSPIYSVATAVLYITSFTFMWFAIKKIDISIAYAIWAGAGTALVAIFGYFIFKEDLNLAKVICLILIICGVTGLKFLGAK